MTNAFSPGQVINPFRKSSDKKTEPVSSDAANDESQEAA